MLRTGMVLFALTTACFSAIADDSVKSTAEEVANDTKRAAKSTARAVKETTCPMVNGKVECAAQKVKHAAQAGADKVEDAID